MASSSSVIGDDPSRGERRFQGVSDGRRFDAGAVTEASALLVAGIPGSSLPTRPLAMRVQVDYRAAGRCQLER